MTTLVLLYDFVSTSHQKCWFKMWCIIYPERKYVYYFSASKLIEWNKTFFLSSIRNPKDHLQPWTNATMISPRIHLLITILITTLIMISHKIIFGAALFTCNSNVKFKKDKTLYKIGKIRFTYVDFVEYKTRKYMLLCVYSHHIMHLRSPRPLHHHFLLLMCLLSWLNVLLHTMNRVSNIEVYFVCLIMTINFNLFYNFFFKHNRNILRNVKVANYEPQR